MQYRNCGQMHQQKARARCLVCYTTTRRTVMRMRETWSFTKETRPFQWTRCCTSARRCRRQCRPTWLWVECRECWAGTSCQLNGSCTSHRSVTRCSWSCTALYDPLGKCSRLYWSSCVPDGNSNSTLNSTDASKTKRERWVKKNDPCGAELSSTLTLASMCADAQLVLLFTTFNFLSIVDINCSFVHLILL